MKKGFLNNFANWILDKLATKVYNQLATSNKTMIGALNELNSKAQIVHVSGTTDASGIIAIPGTFKISKAYCLSNISSRLEYPYHITVESVTSRSIQLRIRKTETNAALINTQLPETDILIIGV